MKVLTNYDGDCGRHWHWVNLMGLKISSETKGPKTKWVKSRITRDSSLKIKISLLSNMQIPVALKVTYFKERAYGGLVITDYWIAVRRRDDPKELVYLLSRTGGLAAEIYSLSLPPILHNWHHLSLMADTARGNWSNPYRIIYLELAELILSSDIFLWLALPFTVPSFSKVAFNVPEPEPGSAELKLKVELVTWLDDGLFLVKVELRASLFSDIFLSNVVFKAFWLSVKISLVLLKVVLAPSAFSNVVFRIFSSTFLAPKFRRW